MQIEFKLHVNAALAEIKNRKGWSDLLTINKDVLQTSFIDMMVYPISRTRLS
jgi:hypothetical protein